MEHLLDKLFRHFLENGGGHLLCGFGHPMYVDLELMYGRGKRGEKVILSSLEEGWDRNVINKQSYVLHGVLFKLSVLSNIHNG